MDIKIEKYKEGNYVSVVFTKGDIVHKRNVNVVFDEKGKYDKDATAERIDDVARGVEYKIQCGLIAIDEPETAPTEEPDE